MSEGLLDLDAYLERINYHGPLTVSEETLRQLHRAHVLSVPFENLDIFLGRPIKIDPDSLMRKIVGERRGGYCYEQNGLFFLVLQQLGFQVTHLAARVIRDGIPQQKSHQITQVEIDGKHWLADVGFGGNGPIDPLPLTLTGEEFRQPLDTYRFHVDQRIVLQHTIQGEWHSLYAFNLEEYYPADYRMMNYFNSTSPDSGFTQRYLAVISTPEARIILNNYELKIRSPRETTTIHLENEQALREALQRYFGIVLPAGIELRKPPR